MDIGKKIKEKRVALNMTQDAIENCLCNCIFINKQ